MDNTIILLDNTIKPPINETDFLYHIAFSPQGDDCLVGPHRPSLLEAGAFRTLLQASLVSCRNKHCDEIVMQV